MDIGIVGLGIIGGSIAKAVKKYTNNEVSAYDIDENTMRRALEEGAIDKAVYDKDFTDCDITFIALYPNTAVDFVKSNLNSLKKGSIIADICGLKETVCEELSALCIENGLYFIGTHPMAGRERWGFDASSPELFQGASVVITPPNASPEDKLELIIDFYKQIGFGNIEISTPELHDKIIAYTSQLAHIVSNAYVKSPTSRMHKGYSAGSYKDLTRVAKLNARMWTELFLLNRENLLYEIDTILYSLNEYKKAIKENDPDSLEKLLQEGTDIKRLIDGIEDM